MRGRGHRRDYGWSEAQEELADGRHPAVVAARLGEPEDYVREVVQDRGWPIRYRSITPDDILDAFRRSDA